MSCNELILLSTDPDDIAILEGPGVQSVNGKVGKVVLDAGDFAYDDTKEYGAGSVGAELKELSQKEIDVDSALSDTSTNPVQNKVVKSAMDKKVTEEAGKGLSTNDFTNAYKTKLDNIEEEANKTIVDSALSLTSENPVQNKVVAQEINDKADVIISTASGSIAHFEDGAEADAKSVIAYIEPVQDLHGYDSPWPAGSGKNLLQNNGSSEVINGITFTVHDDGTVTANGTASAEADFIIKSGLSLKAGSYVLSGCPTGGSVSTYRIFATNIGSDTGSSFAFTFNTTTSTSIRINIKSGTTITNLLFKPMICLSSVQNPTDYEPYSNICPITGHTETNVVVSPTTDAQDGTTYPITFPTEAGTVYGGYVDVTRGKLVVDRASADMGQLSWTQYPQNANVYYTAGLQLKKTGVDNFISEAFTYSNQPAASLPVGKMRGLSNSKTVYVALDVTSVEDFRTAVDGLKIIYELNTPITYQLTPQQITTLLGINNVWADTGDVEVEYRADTKLYIEQLTKPTEDDMTANANIASGKFFMIGNRLFLSTSAIASGDTINPGTNCTELSLADALNNLN